MELEYPDQFEPIQSNGPLAKWKGTIAELLEYLIPLQIAGKLLKLSGEPMAYSDTIKLVESIYGITITAPYDRKTRLFSRKKSETPFLDNMRRVFVEAVEKTLL